MRRRMRPPAEKARPSPRPPASYDHRRSTSARAAPLSTCEGREAAVGPIVRASTYAAARRHVRLAILLVARRVLPAEARPEAVARALRRGFRHGREQQRILSAAGPGDLHVLALAGARGFRHDRQSEPLSDPCPAAAGAV